MSRLLLVVLHDVAAVLVNILQDGVPSSGSRANHHADLQNTDTVESSSALAHAPLNSTDFMVKDTHRGS